MKRLDERARIVREVRAFFESRGYVEVETPLAIPCPGLELHLDAFEVVPTGVPTTTGPDGARPPRFLSTSPEYQMKRLLADGLTRIFQITRAFRVGELGDRHNPEFTILELYRAHAGVEAIMRDTEQLVARVTGGAVRVDGRIIDTRPPFARLTVCEAYERYADTSAAETLRIAEHDEDRFFRLLIEVVEPALTRLDHALFLTEYPASQASLARKKPGDPRVAERFERDRAERVRRGKPVYPIDERFLEALARGMPDSGGNAIGLDRLVALATGTTAIRDVLAFADDEL